MALEGLDPEVVTQLAGQAETSPEQSAVSSFAWTSSLVLVGGGRSLGTTSGGAVVGPDSGCSNLQDIGRSAQLGSTADPDMTWSDLLHRSVVGGSRRGDCPREAVR